MNSTLTLTEFFSTGKMDVDFEIKDGHVIGICYLYSERTAGKDEYIIRETSGVELDKQRGLNACVQDAKQLAYEGAANRFLGNVIAFPASAVQTTGQTSVSSVAVPLTVVRQSESAVVAAPEAKDNKIAPVSSAVSAGEATGNLVPENDVDALGVPEDEKAEQVALGDLAPPPDAYAGSGSDGSGDSSDDTSLEYKKALATIITICGKAHEKYGKTAGEILHSDPELIAYLATKEYGGDKKDEYAAMKTLYPDAVERVHKAA